MLDYQFFDIDPMKFKNPIINNNKKEDSNQANVYTFIGICLDINECDIASIFFNIIL